MLKQTTIFSSLDSLEISIIAENSDFQTFNPGELIYETGSPGRALYIVQEGEVVITRMTPEGKEMDVARLITGDFFGELELFQNGSRNATAKAETQTRLLRFPKEGLDFQSILSQFPIISARLLHGFIVLIAGRIRNTNNLIKENSPWIQELQKQVYGDKLTGLYNRTFLEEKLENYLTGSHESVSLVMFKPDNFKQINDTFGHEAGDEALRLMAYTLHNLVENRGVAVRFMGNELAAVIPSTERERALHFAEELRSVMNNLDLTKVTGGEVFRLTISSGIAVYPDHGEKAEELIERAHKLPLIGRGRGGNAILFPEDKDTDVQR